MSHRDNYSFKHFEYADLMQMTLVEDEAEQAYKFAKEIADLNEKENCYSGIAYVNEVPISMGGWLETEPGAAQLFLFLDKHALLHPKTLFRTIKRWCEFIADQDCFDRVRTFSLDRPYMNKWMERLGFVCEGEANRYTKSGERYLVWSKS